MTKRIIKIVVIIWAIVLNIMVINVIRHADADDVKSFIHTVSDTHPTEIRTRDGKKIEWKVDYKYYSDLDQYLRSLN